MTQAVGRVLAPFPTTMSRVAMLVELHGSYLAPVLAHPASFQGWQNCPWTSPAIDASRRPPVRNRIHARAEPRGDASDRLRSRHRGLCPVRKQQTEGCGMGRNFRGDAVVK